MAETSEPAVAAAAAAAAPVAQQPPKEDKPKPEKKVRIAAKKATIQINNISILQI